MLARVIAIAACPSVRPSVCLSVTSRYCVKTKKASVMILICLVGLLQLGGVLPRFKITKKNTPTNPHTSV